MTVTAKQSRKVLSGSGWANPLTHDFPLENSSYLKVYADDVQLALGVDYSISGVGDPTGYSVTVTTPGSWAPTNWVLNVEPPMNQPSDVDLGGQFGQRFEAALDIVTARVQAVYDMASRAIKAPLYYPVGDQTNLIVDPENIGGGTGGPGSGDVVGPNISIADRLAAFSGTTGKLLKDSGIALSNVMQRTGATMLGVLTLAADPANAFEAATKQYVDNAVAVTGRRGAVRAASTGNINLASPGANIDGIAMAVGNWFLAKDQSTPAQNGVYRWNGAAVAATRVTEFDTYDEHPGSIIAVQEGTVNVELLFICTSNVGGTLGVTAITFSNVGISLADLSVTYAKMATSAVATGGDYAANTASKLLTPAAVWNAMGEIAISETDLVNGINLSLGFDFAVSLTANRAAGNFQNPKVGQRGRIRLLQDATGNRAVTKASNWKLAGGGATPQPLGANAVGYIYYDIRAAAEHLISGSSAAWS